MKKLFIVIFLMAAAALASAEDLKLFGFAEYLFGRGDYYRAIGEYNRYIFYNPSGKQILTAKYRIGQSYFLAGKYEESGRAFEDLSSGGGKTGQEAMLAEAYAYSVKKDYSFSSMLLTKVMSGTEDLKLLNRAWYISGFNLLHQLDWAGAKTAFAKAQGNGEISEACMKLSRLMDKSSEIQQRSPFVGGIMSVIVPGSGYFYSGRIVEGIMALALNSYFIYNTVSAVIANNSSNRLIFGIPAAVFYFSGIYGSANAAIRFNEEENIKFIKSSEDIKVEIVNADF
jgi:TM2 domain-containing membrane protein YozV